MEFRIADTFNDSLARLTAAKQTADLDVRRRAGSTEEPRMRYHVLNRENRRDSVFHRPGACDAFAEADSDPRSTSFSSIYQGVFWCPITSN